ncbi:MAG: hypothetical protein ACRDRA_12065 [Pseudonocardiaceae bacterium]
MHINIAGELHTNLALRAIAREHKTALRSLLHQAARDTAAADPDTLADWLMLLVEGAIVTAHVEGDPLAAARARSAAANLMERIGRGHADDASSRAAERLQ